MWLAFALLLGACVGSFLNVVIYRVPLGLSVNEPKRSFCPSCKRVLKAWQNIPVLSWLILRGKCASCGARISSRYVAVELLTAGLYLWAWLVFPPVAALALWVLVAILVAVSFIDAEHMVIPVGMTWAGSAVGLLACALWPRLPILGGGEAGTWLEGVKHSAIGWAVGFGGLWAVVQLGKLAFGRKAIRVEEPVAWRVREQEGEYKPLLFEMGDESIEWWDVFHRKTDRLVMRATQVKVDGKDQGAGELTLTGETVLLPDGRELRIEDIRSLEGMATEAVVPREAMGEGDVHLLAMIGAFFGWSGVLFSVFSSSIFALVAALVGRLGFGRPLPYGPFLSLGALTWAYGGWKLWLWYLGLLGG